MPILYNADNKRLRDAAGPLNAALKKYSWKLQGTEPTQRPEGGPTPYADWIIQAAARYNQADSAKPGIRIIEQLFTLIHCSETGREVPWQLLFEILGPYTVGAFFVETDGDFQLYMNEKGARMAAAFAGVVTRSIAPQPYFIDRHFVLAVIDGTTPSAVFYLHPDDSWSQPPTGVIAAA